jgi:hypothetical protein
MIRDCLCPTSEHVVFDLFATIFVIVGEKFDDSLHEVPAGQVRSPKRTMQHLT